MGTTSVGNITINLRANLTEFKSGMKDATETANKSTRDMADGMDVNMREARGSLLLVEHELGLHLPREINTLVASIPGIGQAFQTLLPAMAAVFAAKMIYDWVEKSKEAARALSEGFGKSLESANGRSDELRVSIEKSKMAIDKLMGRPVNGAALALAEAKVEANHLAASLQTDLDGLIKLMEKSAHGNIMTALLGTSGSGQAADVAKGLRDEIAKIPHDSHFSENMEKALKDSWSRAQSEIEKNQDKKNLNIPHDKAHPYEATADFTAANKALQEFQEHLSASYAEMDLIGKNDSFKKQAVDLTAANARAKVIDDAYKALAKSREQLSKELAEQDKADSGITDERLHLQLKSEEDKNNQTLANLRASIRNQEELEKGDAAFAIEMAKLKAEAANQYAQHQMAMGHQLRQATLAEEKQAENDRYKSQVDAFNKELAALNVYATDFVVKKAALDQKAELAEQAHQNKLKQIDFRAAEDKKAHLLAVESQIKNGIADSAARAIVEGQNMAQAMKRLGEQMLEEEISLGLKKAMLDEKEKFKDAKHNARKAYKSVMDTGIPFPAKEILAGVEAAVVFAATMAFDQGGIAPENAVGFFQKEEMVLPAYLSTGLQDMIRNGNHTTVPYNDMKSAAAGDTHQHTYNIDARGADAGVEARIHRAMRTYEDRAVSRSIAASADRAGRRR